MKKLWIMCGLLLIIILGGIIYYININKVVTTITIDINPSMQLYLNDNEKVIKVVSINDESKKKLDIDIKGKKIGESISIITNSLIDNGYLNNQDNTILVSIDGKELKSKIDTIINEELQNKQIECDVIIQDINHNMKTEAKKYGISEGKANYIENFIENNPEYNFKDLSSYTINEINE